MMHLKTARYASFLMLERCLPERTQLFGVQHGLCEVCIGRLRCRDRSLLDLQIVCSMQMSTIWWSLMKTFLCDLNKMFINMQVWKNIRMLIIKMHETSQVIDLQGKKGCGCLVNAMLSIDTKSPNHQKLKERKRLKGLRCDKGNSICKIRSFEPVEGVCK